MRFSDAVKEWLTYLRTQRKGSPWTQRSYQSDMTHVLRRIPKDRCDQITEEFLQDCLVAWSEAGAAAASLSRRQSAIKSFCKWGHLKKKLWTANPSLGLETIRRPDRIPQPFDGRQAEQIMALELRPVESMTRALLAYTGIRVATLTSITVGQIAFDAEGAKIRVLTKGGRYQVIEANRALTEQLNAYLFMRSLGPQDFLLSNPHGKPYDTHTIWRWTTSWGRQIEPPIERCHPHKFRHEYATRLLELTKDVRLVQEALGHRNIQSTMGYTRVAQSRLRAAVEGLSYGPTTSGTEH